ncbi:response regulator [Leptolinea tardivitalis]|uniref:Fis family transcriptional regulator n=1 Tax=Leptolinea tardivitalis TaxID=229920 RepID=A0A0P6XPH0_9CHLR|nr:response regulator [Leptolinea tardivitalis]KPL74059.1 Fis family transcriptional regulator [Leptolinea tardivitalis]GAP22702.1 response regulator consisting of a CheY-like receiver domain and a winged-helix DNA-binding domain [Leptolinea tardivitalis]
MTDSLRILIVDDEIEIRRFLRATLSAHGNTIFEANCGQDAIEMVVNRRPDLLILDLGLPDLDGVEVTRRLREWSQIPIIILSVRNQEQDKVQALDAGADDYLTKPFGVGELMARIRVVMRRVVTPEGTSTYSVGGLQIDLARHRVNLAGQDITLTPTEFDLLKTLAQNSGKVMTHRQLITQVWGTAYEDEDRLLRVNIANLRRKLESNPSKPEYILTELGVGYRLRSLE